jgi:DNA-binding FadR family transcriptional regulator
MFNSQLTTKVVDHIRAKLENGSLKPGDKIPPERELAKILNMSRASLRTGIGYLVSTAVWWWKSRKPLQNAAKAGWPSHG